MSIKSPKLPPVLRHVCTSPSHRLPAPSPCASLEHVYGLRRSCMSKASFLFWHNATGTVHRSLPCSMNISIEAHILNRQTGMYLFGEAVLNPPPPPPVLRPPPSACLDRTSEDVSWNYASFSAIPQRPGLKDLRGTALGSQAVLRLLPQEVPHQLLSVIARIADPSVLPASAPRN